MPETNIDLEQRVEIVEAENIFAEYDGILREILRKSSAINKALVEELAGKTYLNRNTNNKLLLTNRDLQHSISSAFVRGLGGSEHIVAAKQIPKLIWNAVLVEVHPDNKQQEYIKEVHRYYAALKIHNPLKDENSIFAVKLTGMAYKSGSIEIKFDELEKLHDLSLEKKMPALIGVAKADNKQKQFHAGMTIILRDLLKNVKNNKQELFIKDSKNNDFGIE